MADEIVPVPKAPYAESTEQPKRRARTYEDDLAHAMDTTDASAVQDLLYGARSRESKMKEAIQHARTRGWYTLFALLFTLATIAALAYAYITYKSFTVPLEQMYSVGVFTSTEPIIANTTDTRKIFETITTLPNLPKNKPELVDLVADEQSRTPLSNDAFYSFIEARVSEPLTRVIESIRLGVVNTGNSIVPFVIFSVNDSEIASKELLIAEPTLLQMFYKVLGIDIATRIPEAGKGFNSEYVYNLPVRILRYPNVQTGKNEVLLLYGYATENIIVVTTDAAVLRDVYDTIIGQ